MFKKFPFYQQLEGKDCGPTCLRMIAKYFGKSFSLNYLRSLSDTTREGSSMYGICQAAEKIHLNSFATKINYNTLLLAPLPCIVFWHNYHYVVVYKIKNDFVYISDPAIGQIKFHKNDFINSWISKNADENTEEGLALFFESTEKFHKIKSSQLSQSNFKAFTYITRYLTKHKKLVLFLLLALLIENSCSFFFPFLTRNIVDKGIIPKNIDFIYLILLGQLILFIGQTTAQVVRSRVLLHLSTRININLVSDFFDKLMNLPISFFDSRLTGDLLERIRDNRRIEQFLTGNSLNTLFSMVNFVIFGGVLFYYNYIIALIFFSGSLLYILWLFFFLEKRKILDFHRFSQASEDQSKTMEIIFGMQEIKINNAKEEKRKEWAEIQQKMYKIQMRVLTVEQWQVVGSSFISQLKDILIIFISATFVIKGVLTLGTMLAIQYIIGQLNTPLFQLVSFIRSSQDAKISLERLSEIHLKESEDNKLFSIEDSLNGDIKIENLTFNYQGSLKPTLENINLTIPKNKITAIVGTSGSGKTTLLKMIMKFYEPSKGNIVIDNQDLNKISNQLWRDNYGVVMQDGFIFNDTVQGNICVGNNENIDYIKLENALKISRLEDFVDSLPLKLKTKIGNDGNGISGGQKQRILIARSVYKNPHYLFFDEATSALDAKNEKVIHDNLQKFFKGKTVVIIAHRLSTVKNADQIVVLEKGEITEIGTHNELVTKKGNYFNLVKNQLELGS
ncbi:MAG: peptidase domain-containing ABC transporter [Flavobacteriales bacterium]|nr:peptidase domain-containing ABC transporter [Flavobacteriales bacterium]